MITFIIEKRNDAIHVYNKALLESLQRQYNDIAVITLDNKRFKHPLANFALELFNTCKLPFLIKSGGTVVYTDPLPFNFLSSLFVRAKKYVIFFHYEQDPSYYRFLPFLSLRKVLRMFDGVISSSQYSLAQLRTLGVDPKRCSVVFCGIDHELFKPTTRPLPSAYPELYLLSVGSEEPRKNMENILKAFHLLKKDFPELRLVKVGRASSKNRQHTQSWIDKLTIAESVTFTNFIAESELPLLYSHARLLLFPSLQEGFGLPVVEAMACGCPVVTSDRDPMLELVGGAGQPTVNPEDPKALAAACKKILQNESYRKTLVSNGIERAKIFNWDGTARAVYAHVTQGTPLAQ